MQKQVIIFKLTGFVYLIYFKFQKKTKVCLRLKGKTFLGIEKNTTAVCWVNPIWKQNQMSFCKRDRKKPIYSQRMESKSGQHSTLNEKGKDDRKSRTWMMKKLER